MSLPRRNNLKPKKVGQSYFFYVVQYLLHNLGFNLRIISFTTTAAKYLGNTFSPTAIPVF